jgi:hypothetical protein
MSNKHFTVTVGGREYRVELSPEGKAIRVMTAVIRSGRRIIRRVFPLEYRDLPGPTVIAVIQAAQAMQQPNQERK